MIKQKPNRKCTVLGKRRVDLYKVQQSLRQQARINQHQYSINQRYLMQIEDLDERVRALENALQQEQAEPRHFMVRLLGWLK